MEIARFESLGVPIVDLPRGQVRSSVLLSTGDLGDFPQTGTSTQKTSMRAMQVRLPDRDQFSLAALMSQHIKCGQGGQALSLYVEMRDSGLRPSSYTLVAALKACSSLHDLESAKHIHADAVVHGYEPNVYVATVLVEVYVKCRSLVDARRVFDKIRHHDVVSWTTMISGYSQMEDCREALQLYARMQEEGVIPNDRTIVAVLKACRKLTALTGANETDGQCFNAQCLEQIKAIHLQVVTRGIKLDVYAWTMLLDLYVKCGSLVDARNVFETMPRRDVVSWTAMILGYAHMDKGAKALQLYAQMQHEGLAPDARAFVGALKACSSLAAHQEGLSGNGKLSKTWCLEQIRAIHSDVVARNLETVVFVGTMLVDVYAKCGSLVDARRVFEKIPHRNVVSWTAMILGYAQMEEGEEALHLFRRMQQEGIVPDARAFVGALKACSSLAAVDEEKRSHRRPGEGRCLEQVRNIHYHIIKSGCEADVFVANMLVDAYAKCGSMVDARRVFNQMPHRNVVSWTAMILGYAEVEDGEVALQLYTQMQQEGVVPNDRTFVGALKACGSVAGLEKGKEIHAQISKAGLELTNSFVGSSLVDMYGKCGSMEDAQRVFDALHLRNTVAWNALIAGYARQGESETVFNVFDMMQRGGIQPTLVTFLSILTVCSHVGLVDEGQMYFESMSRDFGISPTLEHYSCMADLLGRAGHVDTAFEMVKKMPFPPDIAVWRTVLGACQKWRKVELGRHAFESAVRLDKNDAASYMLMSNIYSAARMMESKKEIHTMQAKAQAWKKSGHSRWTDMDGVVHAFTARDWEHIESQTKNSNLDSLCLQMKAKGYVPYLNLVRDMWNGEKDDVLCDHSERLAIAYALSRTPEGTTIRVVNDLRVCENCHTATAVISKLVHRTIICRDSSRFHVYKDGKCSCDIQY